MKRIEYRAENLNIVVRWVQLINIDRAGVWEKRIIEEIESTLLTNKFEIMKSWLWFL